MTEVIPEVPVQARCPECGSALVDEVCVNAECKEAQAVASAAASRETAKATAATGARTAADPAASAQPRSYASSGRPD